MKFRIVKTGLLSYNAEATENGMDWVVLGNFFTKSGAKDKCVSFAKLCNQHIKQKENVVEEFEL